MCSTRAASSSTSPSTRSSCAIGTDARDCARASGTLARFEAHRLELHSNAQVPQGFPPIPAIKYGRDLAKYVGGKFLPEDDVECVDYGVQELELRVGRSGRLQVRPGYDETVDQVVTTPSADGTTYLWQTTVSGPEVLSVGR